MTPTATTNLSATARSHHHLAVALYDGLYANLMVTMSLPTRTGHSRGWTLRPDPLNAQALRFDFLHGSRPTFTDAETATLVHRQVIEVAATIASTSGYRVRHDGTGLYLTPSK